MTLLLFYFSSRRNSMSTKTTPKVGITQHRHWVSPSISHISLYYFLLSVLCTCNFITYVYTTFAFPDAQYRVMYVKTQIALHLFEYYRKVSYKSLRELPQTTFSNFINQTLYFISRNRKIIKFSEIMYSHGLSIYVVNPFLLSSLILSRHDVISINTVIHLKEMGLLGFSICIIN